MQIGDIKEAVEQIKGIPTLIVVFIFAFAGAYLGLAYLIGIGTNVQQTTGTVNDTTVNGMKEAVTGMVTSAKNNGALALTLAVGLIFLGGIGALFYFNK